MTIQAQILRLMRRLREQTGTSILFITHDLGVVAALADRVCVMYGGRIVEQADVDDLFDNPAHPYTRMLLATIPRVDSPREQPLLSIPDTVPDHDDWPQGCRFRTRWPKIPACRRRRWNPRRRVIWRPAGIPTRLRG